MKRSKPTRFLWVLLLFACTRGPSAQEPRRPGPEAPGGSPGAVLVTAAAAVHETVEEGIETRGSLSPDDEVTVSAEVEGTVDAVFVEEGDRVKRGGAIARIATVDYVLKLAEAKAQLALARGELERKERLVEGGLLSPQQFEEVKTKREVAEVAYQLAQERLNKTILKSPLDGYLLKREVSPGEYLKIGSPVAIVIATDLLRYLGTVGEEDAGRVRRGEKILLSVPPFPDEIFLGQVVFVAPALDPATRTLPFEGSVPNRDGRLKAGLFARGRLLTGERRQGVVVPAGAVILKGDETIAFVIREDRAERRRVKVGLRREDRVEIVEGIEAGERVAVDGNRVLTDQARVRIAVGGR